MRENVNYYILINETQRKLITLNELQNFYAIIRSHFTNLRCNYCPKNAHGKFNSIRFRTKEHKTKIMCIFRKKKMSDLWKKYLFCFKFTWLMSAISWSEGIALVKFELEGNILGNKEITSLESTRPLTNCSWAFLNSIFLR